VADGAARHFYTYNYHLFYGATAVGRLRSGANDIRRAPPRYRCARVPGQARTLRTTLRAVAALDT